MIVLSFCLKFFGGAPARKHPARARRRKSTVGARGVRLSALMGPVGAPLMWMPPQAPYRFHPSPGASVNGLCRELSVRLGRPP